MGVDVQPGEGGRAVAGHDRDGGSAGAEGDAGDSIDPVGDAGAERELDRSARRIIAVGGGKGGVGKSLVAANVGIFLATLGKRVVLLDADLGGANLHQFVGVERPGVSLGDLFEKRVPRVEDVVVETAVAGLGLVAGESGPSWIANPRPAQKFRLLHQVQRLDVDYLVVDLGPGSGFNTLDFFLVADVGILVVAPEPTSVENTHRFIKSAFLRRLRRAGLDRAITLLREGAPDFEGGIPAPHDIHQAAAAHDPSLAERVLAEIHAFRPRIVVNGARTRSDADLGPALVAAARRRLGLPIDYLGYIEHDDAAWQAIRKRRPLLVEHPESRAAKGIERVTRKLLSIETVEPPVPRLKRISELTHYELLEIDPGATFEEIRRAYRRVREAYGPDSLVVCGLYGHDRLASLHLRIEEAYDTLMDADRRKAYDQWLFPEGLPTRKRPSTPPGGLAVGAAATAAAAAGAAPEGAAADGDAERPPEPPPPAPPPPEPELGPRTEFTGPLLRQVREARGIDLHTISQRTKIGAGHLRAIEDERFDLMPAPVYVRGFLIEYGKALRLDIARILETYLERYKAARAQQDEERG